MLSHLKTAGGKTHRWRFFRAGGFDQVKLETGDDLAALGQLDQKLWVALSCPTRGLEFDARTMDLIDTDSDGRVRAPEVIAATTWACRMLRDPGSMIRQPDKLTLANISDATDEGKRLAASARQLLRDLRKPDATTIGVDDTTDTAKVFAQTHFNGDGVVPADSAEDPQVQLVIQQMIDTVGSLPDRSGKSGVDAAKVGEFYAALEGYNQWWSRSESEAETLLPLGDATAGAAAAVAAVAVKIDDYFARCRLAAFDARAAAVLNRQESEYLELAARDLKITVEEVAGFPLAQVRASGDLPLGEGVNPAWRDAMRAFVTKAVTPVLGERPTLTEDEWLTVRDRFAAYQKWQDAKAGAVVEKLGIARVREILATVAWRQAVEEMLAKDLALKPEADAIAAVDKLVRLHRNLHQLLVNFVSFRDFYSPTEWATFQAGVLYMDQRACELCIRVDDPAKHGVMAPLSNTYLAYCDVVRKSTGEKMTIAAAFMNGDSDSLMVGRNGVFYDRQGRDWDATITKIVENPISIRQAFFSPYKRLLRWIQEQIAKRAAAADAAAESKMTSAATFVGTSATTGKAPEQKPKFEIGTIAALGVAVGGITAALGMLLQAFFGLGVWAPLGVLGLVLVISGPSMIIAWLKLRQRNLGPLLDASGWAVNAKARINIPFGASLTEIRRLPPGSQRDLSDPYGERSLWWLWLLIAIVLVAVGCWWFGVSERVAPGWLPKSPHVLQLEQAAADAAKAAEQTAAPAAPAPPAPSPATP